MDEAASRLGDLLGVRGMDALEIRRILGRAHALSVLDGDPGVSLHGRIVANVFLEDSTRTRLSFSVAAQRLGAGVVDLTSSGSSVSKGEDLADTLRTVDAMGVDVIVLRASGSGSASNASSWVRAPIVNAGDGRHEHPTQALLDCLTLCEACGRADTFDLSGKRVVIVGDLANSRVARSNIAAMGALGAEVVCCGPTELAPGSMADLCCVIERDFDAVIPSADAVMMLRVQFERHGGSKLASEREYRAGYGLTADRAARMQKGAWVMHPGPMNRGLEIDTCVADGRMSLISEQVSAGVRVRMAVLERAVGVLG